MALHFPFSLKSSLSGLFLSLLLAQPVVAQSLIRDAEIGHALRMIIQPLQKSAGTGGSSVDIFIVNDRTLNAFVAGGNNIFFNTGLILRMNNVEMLQAVMAHELAHIIHGHRAALAANIASTRSAAEIGLIVGIAAAVAAGSDGAGIGVAAGIQEGVRRSFLSFSRSQESAADRASISYLTGAGISPQAAVEVLDIFRGQESLKVDRQDPYVLSHPLTSERISRMTEAASAFRHGPSINSPDIDYWYSRLVIKLNGFIGDPRYNLRHIKESDSEELQTLARAIAYHRLPKPKQARMEMDHLVRMRPEDPYYHELRGQILLESGDAHNAVPSYRRAAELSPIEPLILAGLGRALLATNSSGSVKEALSVLKRAYARDSRDLVTLRNLALAYTKSKQPGMASVVAAERYALQSNFRQAEIHAKRAQKLLPRGATGWRTAQDIIAIATKLKLEKNK